MSDAAVVHGADEAHGFRARWLWLALIPLALFGLLSWSLSAVPLPWRLRLEWLPSLGVSFSLLVDGLSAQLLVLITGIGTLVFVYATAYLGHAAGAGRLFALLLIFMVAMMGAVCADHLLLLFLFWELTSLSSFFLVGFEHAERAARDAARQALFITAGGGLALLAAFILLAQIAGTWSLSGIVASPAALKADPRLPAALALLLVGCFTKSAQFPFHFWLPNAMTAPTPVSAYLHSATMVKLGIYLLARFDPAFNDLPMWESVLIGVGAITAAWAALLALRERDLKRILARSTVSALGTLTLLIGLPTPQASLATIAFLFAHAVYKAPLFFVAGNIDHATGTRSVDELAGLRRRMPWTAAAAVLAGLSMAGLPLSFGYVAKDVITVAKGDTNLFFAVSLALLFVNAVAVTVAAVAAIRVFWGRLRPELAEVRDVRWPMLLPPLLLALLGLEFELLPNIADPLLLEAARAIATGATRDTLEVSRPLGGALTAAELTLAVGLLLFALRKRLRRWLGRWQRLGRCGPEALFHALLRTLPRLAAWHTRSLQHGVLDRYLRVILVALLGLGGAAWLLSVPRWPGSGPASSNAAGLAVAAALIAVGALAAPLLRDRLALLMSIGVVGYGSAALFLFAGAPDVAFTQLMVETALVVVASSVLSRYGAPSAHREPRLRNAAIAAAAGAGTFALLVHLLGVPADPAVAEWLAGNALPEARGRNVVNVVLVDFRALDTLGEISVVVFSALAAGPLLPALPQRAKTGAARALMLERGAVVAYWILLLAAAWLLLRGHHAPGGGFIAALVALAATALCGIVYGTDAARRRLPLAPLPLALTGLLLAVASGLFGLVAGSPFLTHLWWSVELAGLSLKLSTVLLFDLGVFCAVWGAFSAYLLALLEQGGAP